MLKKILYYILIILIIYSLCYYIFSDEIIILQVEKNKLNIDNLLSKKPIVIYDKIDKEFINNTFKYNLIYKYNSDKIWERTKYKYTILYAKNNTNIFITNPDKIKDKIPDENDTIIDMKLNKNQSIILPFKWYYSLENKNNIIEYGIHDYITYLLSFI
tara:strand:+ start:3056 stop:3529 length:474 start_codon:yes stop_codon:yes gene_type:complete